MIVLYGKKWRRKKRKKIKCHGLIFVYENIFPSVFSGKKDFHFALKISQTTLLSAYSSLSNISLMLHSVDSLIKDISPLVCYWSCVSFSFHFKWHLWKHESHIPFMYIPIWAVNSFLSTCFATQRKRKLWTVFSLVKIICDKGSGLNRQ